MKSATFDTLRKIVYEHSGITLGPTKEALVSARVAKRVRALGLADADAYLAYLKHNRDEELVHFLDAVSTNVTSFFREPAHFDFLRQRVMQWASEGQSRFRFWSAACSSGEEPYSMAITITEALNGVQADFKILATDISTNVLRQSQKGEYSSQKIDTMASLVRDRYFERIRADGETRYRASDALRRRIAFRHLNLSQPPFPMNGPLDFVFCRNVMIYFDNRVRANLLGEIYRLLRHGGYLAVGHAESLTGIVSEFRCVGPSLYVKT